MTWREEDFIAYLLIHASYADGTFSPIERQLILQKISDKDFHDSMTEYAIDDDQERIKKIEEYLLKNYTTHEKKQSLLKLLKRQFLSDTKFTLEEKKLLVRIQEII